VKVADGAAVLRFTVDGVNTPAPPSLGVMVTGEASEPPPGSATVKLVEATLILPELGPVRV
jgi:hypothetical protein